MDLNGPLIPDEMEHLVVKEERYDMLINHTRQGHQITFALQMEEEDFYNFELHCETCGWWDHWDERKEDWVG